MRWWVWLSLWLCCGCSTTGHEIGVGVGREFRDGGLQVSDSFDDDKDATDLVFDYSEQDVDSLNMWYVWKFDAKQPRYFDHPPPPLPQPPPVEEAGGGDSDEEQFLHVGGVSIPWATVLTLLGALGLYGGQKGVPVIREKMKKRKEGA